MSKPQKSSTHHNQSSDAERTFRSTAPLRIIRPKEMAKQLGTTRVTLWRAIRLGEFPPPIHVTRGVTGWLESEVDAFLAERRAAANANFKVGR